MQLLLNLYAKAALIYWGLIITALRKQGLALTASVYLSATIMAISWPLSFAQVLFTPNTDTGDEQ